MNGDSILIASEVLQWLLMVFLLVFLLATMQLIGRRSSASVTSIEIQGLKGVNIVNELVTDVRARKEISIRDLLNGQPILIVVTDPTCTDCIEAFRRFVTYQDWVSQSLVVVRGNDASVEEFAATEAHGLRVVGEHRGLGLSSYKPPFATVVDRHGSYVAPASLKGDESFEFLRGVLNAERGLLPAEDGGEMPVQAARSQVTN